MGSTSGLLYSVFLTSYDCKCFMSLPRSVMGWSAMYDCGVSGNFGNFCNVSYEGSDEPAPTQRLA